MRLITAAIIILTAGAGVSSAQIRGENDPAAARRARSNDQLVAWATVWGDTGRTGVFTCDEWKRYATRLFNEADKNHDGYLNEEEFKAIRKADLMLKSAELGYFDDNRDGRVSRDEFVNKPNPFFAKYDRKGQCKVSLDDLVDGSAPSNAARSGRAGRY